MYSKLFRRLQADVPYVGLYASDYTAAISPTVSDPGFSPWIWN